MNDNSDAAAIFVMFVARDNEIVASQGLGEVTTMERPQWSVVISGDPALVNEPSIVKHNNAI